MNKAETHRQNVKRVLVAAARSLLTNGGGVTDTLITDVCEQAGIHPHAFRTLFPTDDSFLDAVNDHLVEECAARIRHGVDQFVASDASDRPFAQAAVALAESWPLDRGGMLIRADRRLQALRNNRNGGAAAAAERKFVAELVPVFSDLVAHLGRAFSWPSMLAVRVIVDTYEGSFETWLLDGNDETSFAESPYVSRTLPTLLKEMTAPLGV